MSLLVLTLAIVLCLAGCATYEGPGAKAKNGETIGLVAGGLIGNQFVNGPMRDLATVGGAIIGARIGRAFGQVLDEEDQRAFEFQMKAALNDKHRDKVYTWTNNKDASGTIQVAIARKVEKTQPILRDPSIEPAPPLEIIGETYVASAEAIVYSGPRDTAVQKLKLAKGERIEVFGRVVGKHWLAVGRQHALVGYAKVSLLTRTKEIPKDASIYEVASSDGDNIAPAGFAVDRVKVSTTCKPLSFTLSKGGAEIAKDKLDTCRAGDGGWSYEKQRSGT